MKIEARNEGGAFLVLGEGPGERLVLETDFEGAGTSSQHASRRTPEGGIVCTSTWTRESGLHTLTFEQRFIPIKEGVRWEVAIEAKGDAWSVPIVTRVGYPVGASTRVWAPWSHPRPNEAYEVKGFSASLVELSDWEDPLQYETFRQAQYHLGAPAYDYEETHIPYLPYARDLIAIPLICIVEPDVDRGCTIALSPEDEMLDLTMATSEDGQVTFRRYFHRLGEGRKLSFTAHVVLHPADWRSSLAWLTQAYADYFDPPTAAVMELEGTGAYSCAGADFDADKMKAMAFRVNWSAHFDFAYMGMFLAPVEDEAETWPPFREGRGPTSIAKMRAYARSMNELGFKVLSYFNVTEFGAKIKYPPDTGRSPIEPPWMDSNDFLYSRFPRSVLLAPQKQKSRPEQPYGTWEGAVVTDCGDEPYAAFLIDQVRRHVERIPESAGICIDRMDWLRLYNVREDDGITWFDGRPARSLIVSWKRLLARLAPIVHRAGKVIYCNPHLRRLDLMRHVDGFFDEFTFDGCALNTLAMIALRKPAIGWVGHEDQLKSDPDGFLQRFLYLRVFPMVPFPENDHAILPSDWVDPYYLDYGPLFAALRGATWLLEPRVVEVLEGEAKVNAFQSPDWVLVPVVYATGVQVRVSIRVAPPAPGGSGPPAEVLHPGKNVWTAVPALYEGECLTVDTPVERGCALLRIRRYGNVTSTA